MYAIRSYYGHRGANQTEHDVLINLASEVPVFFSRFERVAEVIDKEPPVVASYNFV